MRTIPISAIAVVCVTSVLAAAQVTSPQRSAVPPQFQSAVDLEVEPPPGESSWVVQVVTRGGIAGTARRNIMMMSTGQLTCSPASARCAGASSPEAVRDVAGLLSAIGAESWVQAAESLCSDCVRTLVVLHRREQGTVRIHVAHWDQSQTVAPPLHRLYERLSGLGGGV